MDGGRTWTGPRPSRQAEEVLIFAVDRLSVRQRIGGSPLPAPHPALIFSASVSGLAAPSAPSPEGMTCQPLSVQSGRSPAF